MADRWVIKDGYPYIEDVGETVLDTLITPTPDLVFYINNNDYPYIKNKESINLSSPLPDSVFKIDSTINNSYPYLKDDSTVTLSIPLPEIIYKINDNINNGYPYLKETVIGVVKKPYPEGIYLIGNDYPFLSGNSLKHIGAFYKSSIKNIIFPKTITYIGEYAFKYTNLKSITIPADCIYFENSFPDDCVINFY